MDQKDKKNLFIILVLIVLFFFYFFNTKLKFFPQIYSFNLFKPLINKPSVKVDQAYTTNSSITETYSKREIYDFDMIFKNEFVQYKNNKIGFTVTYPREAEIYEFSDREANERYVDFNGESTIGAFVIVLSSQSAEGTELFNGMVFEAVYYKNPSGKDIKNLDITSDGDDEYWEETSLNGTPILKEIESLHGGSINYYLVNSTKEYIILISYIAQGPEKNEFEKIIDKMLTSFTLNK